MDKESVLTCCDKGYSFQDVQDAELIANVYLRRPTVASVLTSSVLSKRDPDLSDLDSSDFDE